MQLATLYSLVFLELSVASLDALPIGLRSVHVSPVRPTSLLCTRLARVKLALGSDRSRYLLDGLD
jgi:hypothetical protein